jgi:DNA helicase II / ATP-dependent DNA helicase PcrA
LSDTLDNILGKNKVVTSTTESVSDISKEKQHLSMIDFKSDVNPSQQYVNILAEKYNLNQILPILNNYGNALIVSAAGSGKTTALAMKICYDFLNGRMNTDTEGLIQKVWLGTFLRSGAFDLGASILEFSGPIGINLTKFIKSSTIHSEFYQVCKELGYFGTIISEFDNKNLFKTALRKHVHVTDEQEDNLYSKADMLRGTLVYDDMLTPVIKDWKGLRNAQNKIDFSDMEEYLYQSAVVEKREEVVNKLRNRYSRIYLDEFQDVSKIQYEILKVYTEGIGKNVTDFESECKNGCIIAIGDDDQSIYSWRGADPRYIVTDFAKDYSANTYHLDVNYRTPKVILSATLPSISNNTVRLKKHITPNRDGGVLKVLSRPTYDNLIEPFINMVNKDITEGRSTAVLVRNNSDALLPAMSLLEEGTLIRLSDTAMTLSGGIGFKVYGLVKILIGSTARDARQGLIFLTNRNRGYRLGISMEKGQNFWSLSQQQISYLDPDFRYNYSRWCNMNEKGMTPMGIYMILREVLNHCMKNRNFRVASALTAMMRYIKQFSDIESMSNGLIEMRDRLKAATELSSKKAQVSLATVHEFKGKESDSVYYWDDTPHRIEDGYLEEERRIHYIATTRAKEIETLVTIDRHESSFFKEMNLSSAMRI